MKRILLFTLLAILSAYGQELQGQMFAYEPNRLGPVTSLSIGAYITSFTYDGASTGNPSFEFERPAIAIRFARPGVDLSILYGWNGGSHAMLDRVAPLGDQP